MRNTASALGALLGLSLGLAVSVSANPASAKGGQDAASSAKKDDKGKDKKKVLVGAFSGAKSDRARKAVLAALKDDGAYDVTETSDVKPGDDDKGFAKAGAGASAVLVGTVSKSGLVLSVRNGSDGALIQDVEVKGETPAKLEANIAESLGLSVADPIAQTKPGATSDAPASDAAAKPEEENPPASDQPEATSAGPAASSRGPSPLELTGGLRAVHRNFKFHDTPSDRFPTQANYLKAPGYTLPLGPAVFIDAALYPLAFGSRGAGALFGIVGGYELNFATKSVYGTPEKNLTTQASAFYAGLKARIPVAAHELGLLAAYGQQAFKLVGDEAAPQAPDVAYKFVRLSADGRFHLDPFMVGLHVGTRLVSDTGDLQNGNHWFAHVKTQALEAGISAGYTLVEDLDLVAGFDLVRYAFDFNPQPPAADPTKQIIAGGGVDQYTSAWLGLRYSLPGHAGP
jgi:hypothetical protein